MSAPAHIVPVGGAVCIGGLTGRVVEHQVTRDRRAVIVTYRVPDVGFGSYVVEQS